MNRKNTILQTFFELNGKAEKLPMNINAAKNAFSVGDNRKYEELLCKAALSSEKLCLSLRSLANDTLKVMGNPLGYERIYKDVYNLAHKISIQKIDYFYNIKMPITLPHYENKKPYLTMPLNSALRDFNKENKIIKFNSAVIIFENHVKNTNKNVRDNDNYEYKQIINSVAFWFVPDDSFDCCSMYNCTKIDTEDYTNIYIVPTEKFADFFKNNIR